MDYFHVVFTLRTIAANPTHLGARIGATLILHTWKSALKHHPHVHGIVPGGDIHRYANFVTFNYHNDQGLVV